MLEITGTIAVDRRASFARRLSAFVGPGLLVAVGYMDPGNWATGVAAGSAFGNSLLWVVALSSAMAIVLQMLAARLGIASGRDLAQMCRAEYGHSTVIALWLLCELSICATDLAEVIGTAMAFQLLFGIGIVHGVCLTALDAFLVLYLQRRGFRYLEAITAALIATIIACFAFELALAHPSGASIVHGLAPDPQTFRDPAQLYVAIGIVGATVMPHNLYLHSAVVQTRRFDRDIDGKRDAARLATFDLAGALVLAMGVNAAILILSASAFHTGTSSSPVELRDAYRLISPALGASAAGVAFGVGLLAAGKSSTVTATLTGQIVMEGFLSLRLRPWVRRAVTRALAIGPALIVVVIAGEHALGRLLVLSQVVLSLQLPFAVIPLVRMTGDPAKMGALASPRWLRLAAWACAAMVIGLNVLAVAQLI
ncbi:MAG TPA: Nramp family divalent metal transporter [Kofleriaceae bacterium]